MHYERFWWPYIATTHVAIWGSHENMSRTTTYSWGKLRRDCCVFLAPSVQSCTPSYTQYKPCSLPRIPIKATRNGHNAINEQQFSPFRLSTLLWSKGGFGQTSILSTVHRKKSYKRRQLGTLFEGVYVFVGPSRCYWRRFGANGRCSMCSPSWQNSKLKTQKQCEATENVSSEPTQGKSTTYLSKTCFPTHLIKNRRGDGRELQDFKASLII